MSGAARSGATGETLAGAADVRGPRAVRGPGGEGAAGEAVEGPRQQPLPRPRRLRIGRRSGGKVWKGVRERCCGCLQGLLIPCTLLPCNIIYFLM